MIVHNYDAAGDWFPVHVADEVISGKEAIVQLIRFRMHLWTDEWWENPNMGLNILRLFQENRITETSLSVITTDLTNYIAEIPGVLSVENMKITTVGRTVNYSCKVYTSEGAIDISEVFG